MKIFFLILFSLSMVGCAGTSLRVEQSHSPIAGDRYFLKLETKVGVTEEGLAILRNRLTEQLQTKNLLSDKDAKKSVSVIVTTYNMRHGASRALLGIMAGKDSIISIIKIKDKQSNKVIAEFTVESGNPSAWGSAQGLIEEHADTIVKYIETGNS